MIMLTMMSYIDITIIMPIKARMACYSRHSVLQVLNQQYTLFNLISFEFITIILIIIIIIIKMLHDQ